jgi:16S rRNA (guanine966-N2)-methyltransferase
MRIIAGQRRGHKFDGPHDRDTRPTSDLVREAIFNILRETVEDMAVVDLFAGTGALGLEALSRGAYHATFVERDRENVALIRRNLATLRFEDRGSVLAVDAYRWAKSFEPLDDRPLLVFVDPPYRDFERRPEKLGVLITALGAKLPAGSTLIVESGRPFEPTLLENPQAWDVRRYGGTYVALMDINPESAPLVAGCPTPESIAAAGR